MHDTLIKGDSQQTVRGFMGKEISVRKYRGLHGKTSQNLLFCQTS